MSNHAFPQETRRVILVLDRHDLETHQYDEPLSVLSDPEVFVLPFPIPSSIEHPFVESLKRYQLLRPGRVLIQNPFEPDIYADFEEAQEQFALVKCMKLSHLSAVVGASSFVVESVDETYNDDTVSMNNTAELADLNLSSGGAYSKLKKQRAQIEFKDTFRPITPNLAHAQEILNNTGLIADPTARELVAIAQLGNIRERRFSYSLTRETRANLDVAARISLPPYIHIGTKICNSKYINREISMTVTIRFGETELGIFDQKDSL